MPNIEVLAVEIKQFRGKSAQTLVPRVIGRLAASPGPIDPRPRSPRRKMTRESLLEALPNEAVRGAATRLLSISEECGGRSKYLDASVSIRAVSAAGELNTIALIYRPEAGFLGQREFAFGDRGARDRPGDLRRFLEGWVRQFEADEFTALASEQQAPVWVMSYADAAQNIDLLADRLRTALTEIRKL